MRLNQGYEALLLPRYPWGIWATSHHSAPLQPPSFSPFLQSDYSVALRCIRTLVAGRGQGGGHSPDPVCNDLGGV